MSRGGHGAYRLWLCRICGGAVVANHWRRHFIECLCVPVTQRCELCADYVPCRKEWCPKLEKPKEVVERGDVEIGSVRSLKMKVRQLANGKWEVKAPWLLDWVSGDTWEDAYWAAVRAKSNE